MIDAGTFTEKEFIPFLGILIVITFILTYNYIKGFRAFWSPLSIIAIIYAYYCCLGPYNAVVTGDTYDRLLNMRKFYESSLWGALISLSAYCAGFWLHGRGKMTSLPAMSTEYTFYYGVRIFLIGFFLFTVSTGGNVANLINPLDAQYVEQVGGSLGNYLGLSLNFVIPGITLMFVYFLKTKRRLLWFVIPFFICIGIFITLGFRYRLVLLFCSLAIVYFVHRGRRPNLVFVGTGIFVFILMMGAINISRQYGIGLQAEKLEGGDTEKYYASGLRESLIFQTSGAIIDIVPDRHPHAGLQPIWSTVIFPIPKALYPEKNSSEYLFDALDEIYGKRFSKGAAIMAYAEYYLAFGWFGIVIGCAFTGWMLRKLWNWYLFNSENPLVLVAYAVTTAYLYVVISRGYLPQVVNLFFFSVVPVYVALRMAKKRKLYVVQRKQ